MPRGITPVVLTRALSTELGHRKGGVWWTGSSPHSRLCTAILLGMFHESTNLNAFPLEKESYKSLHKKTFTFSRFPRSLYTLFSFHELLS